jgi:proteasome accessory factor B
VSRRRTERLLNLVIALLSTRRYLTAGQIRAAVPGYGEADDGDDGAFRRMFERDKEDLRDLGIPLETGTNSVWDDEPGYRISRRDYELPEIQLAPDEAAAVALAARAWRSARLGPAAAVALQKVTAAAGALEEPAPALDVEPLVDATEPAFDEMLDAVRNRQPVRFDYRTATAQSATTRRLLPWGVVSWRGRWYVVGHDRDRGERRIFRLSRVVGAVRADGPAESVDIPDGLDLVEVVARYAAERPDRSATLRIRAGRGHDLRRGAVRSTPGEGWDEVVVGFSDAGRLADRILWHGADVVVLDPPDVRDTVVNRLRRLAADR